MQKKLKYTLFTFSAVFLLAACEDEIEAPTETEEPAQQEQITPEEEPANQTEDMSQTETEEQPVEETVESDQAEDTTENNDQETTEVSSESDSPGIENREFEISLNDAIEIYYDEIGEDDISVEEIEFERDDGRFEYEIEGYSGNMEYEMEIDAETGNILDFDIDDEDDFDTPLDLDGIISPQEAMEAALSESDAGFVDEWELEIENGRTMYEIDIEGARDRYVDAHTGEIY